MPSPERRMSSCASVSEQDGATRAMANGESNEPSCPLRSAAPIARSVPAEAPSKTFTNQDSPKNAASAPSTVGTTSARSRKSLCCSHDVSAISRQPWQAARAGSGPAGSARSCWAQTGSFGAQPASSRAARRCRSICRRLDQPAQRPLRVGRAGVEQDAVARLQGVDPLADRTGRVAALQRHRRQQQVRQRVHMMYGGPGTSRRKPGSPFPRHSKPSQQLNRTPRNGRSRQPRLDGVLASNSRTAPRPCSRSQAASPDQTPGPLASTSSASSPLTSGTAASNRVKPIWAITSRRR